MSNVIPLRKEVGVYELTPFTQLDFPGELACIVWFAGCNLRCGYCHNPEMVTGIGTMPWTEILAHLYKRRGRLTGVVFSGGEATLHPAILDYARQVKQLGFKLKLDSNGTRPDVLRQLLAEGLLGMVAFDYKAPREAYKRVAGVSERLWDKFSESLDLLISHPEVQLEVRTTVHTGLLDEADINTIRTDLEARGYRGVYHVQNYRHGETLGNLPCQTHSLQKEAIPQGRIKVMFRNF